METLSNSDRSHSSGTRCLAGILSRQGIDKWHVDLDALGLVTALRPLPVTRWCFEGREIVLFGNGASPVVRLSHSTNGCWSGEFSKQCGGGRARLRLNGDIESLRPIQWETVEPTSEVAFVGYVDAADGIGKNALLVGPFYRAGIDTRVLSYHAARLETIADDRERELIRGRMCRPEEISPATAVLASAMPPEAAAHLPVAIGPRLLYTMFEADRIPNNWVTACDQFDQIIVPMDFLAAAFRASGVTRPVAVVPHGMVVPRRRLRRQAKQPFIFGTSATALPRKNLIGVLRAFQRAFPRERDEPVCLNVQGRYGTICAEIDRAVQDDPRIAVLWKKLDEDEFEAWWDSLDCYVVLSKGEGFGLTPREAILRGIPTIASDNSGHATIPEAYYYPVPSTGTEPGIFDFSREPIGVYWTPDEDVTSRSMRHVYENYAEAVAKTEKARTDNWAESLCYSVMAQRLVPYLRPRVVMVCPSVGQRCGIAEYTRYVQDELNEGGIGCLVVSTIRRACEIAQSTASVSHVIVEYEYGLFDGVNSSLSKEDSTAGMVQQLRELEQRRNGVRAILMLHAVGESSALKGQNEAIRESGLAAFHLTREGASRFGVAYIEHGVPRITGVSARRTGSRDRLSIGSFGIFGPNRNLECLTALCRQTRSRLVGNFYCDSESKRRRLTWALSTAGIEHRVTTDFPPDRELFARLRDCDLLFMPRTADQGGYWFTSGSVRLGINLGVPIIVNGAACYSDIGDAVIVAEDLDGAIEAVERLRNPVNYREAVEEQQRFAANHRLVDLYSDLLERVRPQSQPIDHRDQRRSGKVDE
jgi:hypothetical protein